jgi:hypothetical protein
MNELSNSPVLVSPRAFSARMIGSSTPSCIDWSCVIRRILANMVWTSSRKSASTGVAESEDRVRAAFSFAVWDMVNRVLGVTASEFVTRVDVAEMHSDSSRPKPVAPFASIPMRMVCTSWRLRASQLPTHAWPALGFSLTASIMRVNCIASQDMPAQNNYRQLVRRRHRAD